MSVLNRPNSGRWAVLIYVLGGAFAVFVFLGAEFAGKAFSWDFSAALPLCGGMLYLADLYLIAVLIKAVANIFGGTSSLRNIRVMLGWSSVPFSLFLACLTGLALAWDSRYLPVVNAGLKKYDATALGLGLFLAATLGFQQFVQVRMIGAVLGLRFWRSLGVFAFALGIPLAFSFGVRAGVIRPFHVPATSMAPALVPVDYFYANMLACLTNPPERGDIAVLRKPQDPATDYIKRIAGIPGDKVSVRDGWLVLNGEDAARSDVECPAILSKIDIPSRGQPACYEERLPGGLPHSIVRLPGESVLANFAEVTVPPGHYFVLGDNRDNSADSRMPDFRMIPLENIRGRVSLLYFTAGIEARGGRETAFVRWDRMFCIPQ